MKKSILNLGAIAIAFCLGISIHNSCADPDNYNTTRGDASTEELWAAIDALKQEVNELKSKVQTLENSAGTETNSGCGEFCIDGLWFNRSGFCTSPIKSITDYNESGAQKSKTEYLYDADGRYAGYDAGDVKVAVEYNGKEQTTTWKIRSSVNGMTTTTKDVTEYK